MAQRLPAALVLAADCTYNPQYFDAFYKAITDLTDMGGGSEACGQARGSGDVNRSSVVLLSHDRDSVPSRINHCEKFVWSDRVQRSFEVDEIQWQECVASEFRRESIQIFRLARRRR